MGDGLPARVLAVGLLLILVSFVVPLVVGSPWNDRMARQLQQASQNYHDALHQLHAVPHAPHELIAARAAYQKRHDAFSAAANRGRRAASWIRWAGILVSATGVVLHVVKQSDG